MNTLKAVRTNCRTGEETEQELEYYFSRSEHDGNYWLYLMGGPTGFESAMVKQLAQSEHDTWCACAGTPNVWDKLIVDITPIKEIFNG